MAQAPTPPPSKPPAAKPEEASVPFPGKWIIMISRMSEADKLAKANFEALLRGTNKVRWTKIHMLCDRCKELKLPECDFKTGCARYTVLPAWRPGGKSESEGSVTQENAQNNGGNDDRHGEDASPIRPPSEDSASDAEQLDS
jgi:hypothetical protein